MIEQLGRRHVGVLCVSRARYRVLFLFLPLKEGAEIDHAQLSAIPLARWICAPTFTKMASKMPAYNVHVHVSNIHHRRSEC